MTARPLAFAAAGLTKTYDTVTAVDQVSFVVPSGRIAALVGPAGAGKTTVLRLLLGLQTPTSGSARVGGHETGSAPAPRPADQETIGFGSVARRFGFGARTGALTTRGGRQLVGAVLTPRGFAPNRTVRAQLRVFAAAAGVSDIGVEELLALARLDEVADQRLGVLPEGIWTRLALTVAMLGNPPLLILDDPAAGCTPPENAWLHEFLRGHAHRGGTVLFTARTLSAALPVADELIVLDHGRIVYQGSPARLRRSHPDRLLVKSSSPIALATALAARGYTDAVMRPDGRLAVAEASLAQLESAASLARVQLTEIIPEHVHPDQVLAALTGSHTPRPAYGMPR